MAEITKEDLDRLEQKIDWLAQGLHAFHRRVDDVLLSAKNGGVKSRLHIWQYPEPNNIAGAKLPNLVGNPDLDRATFIDVGRSDDPTP